MVGGHSLSWRHISLSCNDVMDDCKSSCLMEGGRGMVTIFDLGLNISIEKCNTQRDGPCMCATAVL